MTPGRRTVRRVLVAAVMTTALGASASPAAAHGTCAFSTSVPTYDGLWHWTVTAACTESHATWDIDTCLQSSQDPLGVTGWTSEGCRSFSGSTSTTNVTLYPTVAGSCVLGRWYRSWASASLGAGGGHSLTATSSPTLCTPRAG